jgi:hypothetical protein
MADEGFIEGEAIKPQFNIRKSQNLASNLTLKDLAKMILFKFGSIQKFSQKMGWDRSRGVQILKGYKIPENPDIIKKIAELVGIDVIVLVQLFERSRKNNGNGETG